jgi:hypothetical protein
MKIYKLLLVFVLIVCTTVVHAQKSNYYFLKVYHYATEAQGKRLNDFFAEQYVPGLHKAGFKQVGVFQTLITDTADKRFYILIPAKKIDELEKASLTISDNNYFTSEYNNAPYSRIETIVLNAFPMAQKPIVPDLTAAKTERVYELRSYESPTERYFQNKVHMFNEGGEIDLFKRLNFNAVFYASVIAGGKMPNLMYMTSFNNKADRDQHWKSFGEDAQWKTLSSNEFYKNNVSKIEITFLHGLPYSDF